MDTLEIEDLRLREERRKVLKIENGFLLFKLKLGIKKKVNKAKKRVYGIQ